jgi:acetyltransferase
MLTINKKKSIQLGWRLYQQVEEATKAGRSYNLRMATAQDLPLLTDFLAGLSANTRYLRFLSPLPAFTPERAETMARQLWLANAWPTQVLLATVREDSLEEVIGLGEWHLNPSDDSQADFALLVRDEWQSQGIGTVLLKRLVELSGRRGVTTLRSEIHPTNRAMRKVLSKLNLPVSFHFESGTLEVVVKLAG